MNIGIIGYGSMGRMLYEKLHENKRMQTTEKAKEKFEGKK